MSDTALAAASRTLRTLLRDRMRTALSAEQLTLGPPPDADDFEGLNLFLYRVEKSPFLANQDLPTAGHPGRYGTPPLTLVLHYLLTAYGQGTDGEETAYQRLGDAMRVLHDYPIVTENLRRQRLANVGDPVLDADLRQQCERVKVTLDPMSLDDISKLWTAINVPYRLSASYAVHVVQIEAQAPRTLAPPVLDLPRDVSPRVFVVPFESAQIQAIEPGFAAVGQTLRVEGSNLGRATSVRVGRLTIPAGATAGGLLLVEVPGETADAIPVDPEDQLRAGPQPVQLVSAVAGQPSLQTESNVAAFVLVPEIQEVETPAGTVTQTDAEGGAVAVAVAGERVTVEASPRFGRGDRAFLYVGDRGVEADPLPYDEGGPDPVEHTTRIRFTLPTDVGARIPPRPDPYALRLRVNGAENRTALAGTPPHPVWRLRIDEAP